MRHIGWIIAVVLLGALSAHGASSQDRGCKVFDIDADKIINTCLRTAAIHSPRASRNQLANSMHTAGNWHRAQRVHDYQRTEAVFSTDTGICIAKEPCIDSRQGCAGPSVRRQFAYLQSWVRAMWCR